MTRPIIARIIDTATPLTAANCAAFRKAGYAGVARYLGAKTHGWSKAMTPAEAKIISASGLKITSIWEGDPVTPAYFTPAQGIQDAKDSLIEAAYLGQPKGTAIYATVDFEAQASNMNAIRAYYTAFAATLAGYDAGIYGGLMVVNNVHAPLYWQACAWSGDVISPRASLYQHPSIMLFGVSVDEDDVFEDPGWWTLTPALNPEYVAGYNAAMQEAIKLIGGMKP